MIKNQNRHVVYGVVGMVGLFLFGVMIGYIINGSDRVNLSTMTKSNCNDIADRIISAAKNNQPDLIEQLDKVYSENCLNRVFEQPKPQPKVEEKKLPDSNCEAIEELLKQTLNDENNTSPWAHNDNARIYQRIVQQGCEKNKEKYWNLAQREMEIARALDTKGELEREIQEMKVPVTTCEKIEVELSGQLRCKYSAGCSENNHINDAQIYANLSERGCPENSGKYRDLAKQELEIARALTDDDVERNRHESIEIVETYKRLQMQAEAERMIEKAKKLTNPAIDFIIQLEKIIEE